MDIKKILADIDAYVQEGNALGLDLNDISKKVKATLETLKSGKVSIVLVGSFADGKTSAIAGLMEKVKSSMKIDLDESSDDVEVYTFEGLGEQFEIVDTPGLFGTKEKEYDGKILRYSDKTRKYVSEASIVVYVCNAITPLKDSHSKVMHWILRDLDKLGSTIFVLNKMDDICDMLDDEEYQRTSSIKKEALIKRLRETIDLTDEEERNLSICCISADPKGKGLEHWLTKLPDYNRRSHMGDFKQLLNKMTSSNDAESLNEAMAISVIKDSIDTITNSIKEVSRPLETALTECDESCKDLRLDADLTKGELISTRKTTVSNLDNYKGMLTANISSASLDNFHEVVDRYIGVSNGQLDFSVVNRNISGIMQTAELSINSSVEELDVKFERSFSDQENFLKEAANAGLKKLGNVTVSREQVFAVRDALFKSFKFKPWGALKLANNITKGLSYAAAGLGIVIEAVQWYKQNKALKQLEESKKEIIDAIGKVFKDLNNQLGEDDRFFKNFAPAYLEMEKALGQREKELTDLRAKVKDLEDYREKVKSVFKADAEDVAYEEV